MPEVTLCQHLPWDSEFFGSRIGRLIPTRVTPAEMRQALAWSLREQVECLYFLADSADIGTIRLAEESGFQLVDLRITLETRGRRFEVLPSGVRPYQVADADAIRDIVRSAHTDSRFFADDHFSRDKCAELYVRWLQKDSQRNDGVLLIAEAAGVAVGYITVRNAGDHAQIGLLGVGESARGQGLGLELVRSAVNWSVAQGISLAKVVTQGKNTQAQRLYQRAGFVTRSVELWYHRWFTLRVPNQAV